MQDKSKDSHSFCITSCRRRTRQTEKKWIYGFVLFASFGPLIYSQIPSGMNGALQVGEGAQDSTIGNCSDPLLAATAECMGATEDVYGGLSSSPAAALLARQYGQSATNPKSSYSDVEELNQNAAPSKSSAQSAERGMPKQPLTEFQKFIAETTGQILPIYGENLFQRVPSTFSPLGNTPVPPQYVLGPGDELRIRIWGNVNVQDNVRVDRAGNIYLPQIGPVHVAGLADSELESHLREAVSRVYRNFNLIAEVGQTRAIQVYVTGEARRPGVYTVSALSTLVDALFSSGGPSVEGSLRRIELRRNGKQLTIFDLYGFLINGDKSKDVSLLDGDVVYIPPAGPQVAVTGSVRNPRIYEIESGDTLGRVIDDAGGVSAVAAEVRISIERMDKHHDREAMEVAYDTTGLATPASDGDLIRVLPIVPAYRRTVILRGNTANPGRFAWVPGMRISDLIPDKESLLTRNYWWKRAQLGLPAPEFEPQTGLSRLGQPSGSYPIHLPLGTPPRNGSEALVPYSRMEADGTLAGPAASGAMGEAAGANTLQNGAPGASANPPPPLPAQQQAANVSVAAEQGGVMNHFPSSTPRNEIQLSAPEIDWDYAVIERLDPGTLKTKLIPFDLGKVVLDHDASQNLALQPGDVVTVFSQADVQVPIAQQTKFVHLEGEFVHAGVYSVYPGETLRMLVKRAGGFSPDAYLYGSAFTRRSARLLQQERIDEYVQSMNLSIERGVLALVAAPAATAKDMASGAAASGMEHQLLASLGQLRATGRIVLDFTPGSAGLDSLPNIALENGDTFVVPPVPSTVNVVGAVYNQNSFLYTHGLRLNAYLRLAGGPNQDADRKHAFVIRADGAVVSYAMTRGPWGYGFDNLTMNPGDTIVVPDKTLKPSFLRGVFDWSQLFSQLALGAAALTVILP